ncbi:hypothetical protein [Stenotrophomonas phage RAS14]
MNTLSTTINSTTFNVSTHVNKTETGLELTRQHWEPVIDPIVVSDETLTLERFVLAVESVSFDGPDYFHFGIYHTSKKALRNDLNTLIEYRKSQMVELQAKAEAYWPLFDYEQDDLGVEDTLHVEYLAVEEKLNLLRSMRFEVNGKSIHMGHFDDGCTFKILTLDEWFNAN